ncbi:phosphate ABC transporter permease subunit PstC [Deinococcus peraridilitoris]|uniref:Phosphate transport system permease protein n=1 Tax=Deinococcus peraridilitoris (strain DSM 19664 / LMG 22246 / CIP 109416 / KR-200) TaxID=937777 RepID=L0A0M1_DEIPD|nr:phosphate ABC transporter permease subunit PstC [Deinococcus peraridilitoris]AFZ66712.1 phosphate ABC transporter, permease protein PstC [Deinococcus peraridilitoris DSM 19664]
MTKITPVRPNKKSVSSRGDGTYRALVLGLALTIVAIFAISVYELASSSLLSIREFGWRFLVDVVWNPVTGRFGALNFIVGTILTSVIALIIAVPLAIGGAIFVTEYAPRWIAEPVSYLVELLAAIPSVIYGLWAVFVLVPMVRSAELWIFYQPWIVQNPLLKWLVPSAPTGFGLMTASLILAVMVIPYTASVSRDVIRLVPADQREAMYALGATKWEVIRGAILPFARAGIFGGVILSLGRALGETMAVTMVIGNTPSLPGSIWDSTATMSSVIANEFTEAVEDLHLSSLIEVGLLLFAISVIINYLARLIIARLTPKGTH